MSKLILVLILALAGCAAPQVAAPTPVPQELIFMAGYKAQANLPFVGVYLTQDKGFFRAEGLQVTIQHSAGQGQHLQLTAAGKVHVTTQDAAVLLQRRADPGLPLVSFALVGQKGQQAFAALASSGLKNPKDWEGRLVGYKGTPPPDLLALMKVTGTDPAKVKLVNVGFDPRLLVTGTVDVYPVFKSNEPFLLKKWGYDITLWDAGDFGVPALGLTYVTSDATLQQNPEMLTRFWRAAKKGMLYAADHRDEAVQSVLRYAGPETDPDNMRFMLDAELLDAQSELTRQYGLGWQTHAQWQGLADMLKQYNNLPNVDVGSVFTTRILELGR